jgi:integrase
LANPRVPHLIRRGEGYYFRRAVPSYLVSCFGRREIKLSLGTNIFKEARWRCRTLATAFEQVLDRVEQMSEPTANEINNLLRKYFEAGLKFNAENVEDSLGGPHPGFDVENEAALATGELAQLRQMVATRNYSRLVQFAAERLAVEDGYDFPVKGGDKWDELCHGVARANVENRRIYLAMLSGDYSATMPLDPLFAEAVPEVKSKVYNTPHIAVMVEQFLKFKASTMWANKTHLDYVRVLKWFEETVGENREFGSLKGSDIAAYRDLLMAIPKNLSKSKSFEDMKLKEVIATSQEAEKLSMKTIRKYFMMMKTFVNWCCDELDIPNAPGAKIKIAFPSNPQDARLPFSSDQLTRLFSSPLYSGCKSVNRRAIPGAKVIRDGKFWIPLVALFSGMRMGEIIQLGTEDFRNDGGIWYLDINSTTSNGVAKKLKTTQSKRRIPIHEQLVQIGFVEYCKHRIENPGKDPRLFPEVKPGKDGYASHNFSKWFGRYVEQVDVKKPKTSFHSFRHNFKDRLHEAGVSDSHQHVLMGHSDKSVSASYGSGLSIGVLFKDMSEVSYPELDLSHLHSLTQVDG